MPTTTAVSGTVKSTKFSRLKKGDVLSETQYYKVVAIVGSDIQLLNEGGEDIVVNAEYINSCMTVADHFNSTEKKTRTELAQLFLSHPYTAITVNFNKQVKSKEVTQEIVNLYKNTSPAKIEAELTKTINRALEGSERTARGWHTGHVNEFGRVEFIDMDKDRGTGTYDGRLIQVDPRTLNWLIIKDVKYITK